MPPFDPVTILYQQEGAIAMPEEYRNIYKTYRKAAGLTQEAAAKAMMDLGIW